MAEFMWDDVLWCSFQHKDGMPPSTPFLDRSTIFGSPVEVLGKNDLHALL
jgi:hypothetical protein